MRGNGNVVRGPLVCRDGMGAGERQEVKNICHISFFLEMSVWGRAYEGSLSPVRRAIKVYYNKRYKQSRRFLMCASS
jgi:hypothetical protein